MSGLSGFKSRFAHSEGWRAEITVFASGFSLEISFVVRMPRVVGVKTKWIISGRNVRMDRHALSEEIVHFATSIPLLSRPFPKLLATFLLPSSTTSEKCPTKQTFIASL